MLLLLLLLMSSWQAGPFSNQGYQDLEVVARKAQNDGAT